MRKTNPKDLAGIVFVPAGPFTMGSDPKVDPYFWGAEGPQHTVTLSDYWIYETEVTNAMYRRCTAAKACPVPQQNYSRINKTYYPDARFDNYPVIFVSWTSAQAYCRWAGGRLPSESEWERAARANHDWDFVWGVQNLGPGSRPVANVRDESRYRKHGGHVSDAGEEWAWDRFQGYDDGFPDLAPVGSFPPNDFGLHDMAGNAWEWTEDHGPAAFKVPTYDGHPTDGRPRLDRDGQFRVIRGGGWDSGPYTFAVWMRDVGSAYGRGSMLGFRCVRDTPP